MGIFSRFEDRMEDTVEGAASRMSKAPISPVQIAKRAERQMRREAMVGAGKEYAPTLYTVLVNPDDDARLFGYYPTLAGETETYLKAHAEQAGMVMDGDPLVRFIVDDSLRHGRFDVIAETVSAPIIEQLREEEMEHYGLAPTPSPAPTPARRTPSQDFPDNDYDGYNAGIPAGPVPGTAAAPHLRARAADTVAYGGGAGAAAGAGAQSNEPRTARAQLIELATQRPYVLSARNVVMGRDSGCDIPVKDISASRNHAELALSPQGTWVITDLNSTNGTLVNGAKIASQPLYVGDIITIGKTDFEFALA